MADNLETMQNLIIHLLVPIDMVTARFNTMWVCLIAISSSVAFGLPMLDLVSPFSILCFVLYVFHALGTL